MFVAGSRQRVSVVDLDSLDSSREAVLTRERERFLGFPLFISAYTQTVGFHRHFKGDLDLLARDNPDTS
jgi:hypothetical protein